MIKSLVISVLLLSVTAAHAADPFAYYQWGLWNQGVPQLVDLDPLQTYRIPARVNEDIQLPKAVVAQKKVIVAVLDTGVQKNHPDLKNVIYRKESECKALTKFLACEKDKDRKECEKTWMDLSNPEVDQDKNGYPMDCEGWSLLGGTNPYGVMGRPDYEDTQGHGTHVAGIIAAQGDNGIGIRGVSNNVQILPVQVLGVQPSEPLKPLSIYDSPLETGREKINRSLGDLVARGVIYAMNSGAKVINFSMGWPGARDSEFMRSVIKEAQSRGVIIVAAAGNDSTRALLRPCGYENVICVGASGPDGAMAHFSNYGSGVDILAPGVNILSTYPESKRPVRFRSTLGYEYLSGTSQAAPFVAGIIGEMLARGIPADEIYPRLVAASRVAPEKLPLMQGNPHEGGRALGPEKKVYDKYSVGGNVDLVGALKVSPQAVIIPAQKEKIEINWDRKSRDMQFKFSLVNKWKPVDSGKVKVTAQFVKPHAEAVRPQITQFAPTAPYKATWDKGEVREYAVSIAVTDANDPADSRIPSELDLTVNVSGEGMIARNYNVETEVTVELTPQTLAEDIQVFPVRDLPKAMRANYLPIDEYMDSEPGKRDYFAVSQNGSTWQVWLMREAAGGRAYETVGGVGGTKIKVEGKEETIREQVLARMDINNDGRSEYVLGVMTDNSEEEWTDGKEPVSPMTFYIFDQQMKLMDSFTYTGEKAPLPYRIYWQTIKGRKMPAWVGGGKDPGKKRGLRDRWENPDDREKPDVRFYYLDEKQQLKTVGEYQGYKIIDVLEPHRDQLKAGRVPVLLAKNSGTEAKPSYLYNFAVAEIYQGKVESFTELDLFANKNTYRNILDTRVDRVNSLDVGDAEYAGNFWFSEERSREQRMTVFDAKNWDLIDQALSAERSQFDSALWVRAVFAGQQRKGAFVLTNSEIQYHDLLNKKAITKSFERYTFYPDMLMTNLYFPMTLTDSKDASVRLPALFTTETSGLSRGVKMLVPVLAKDGSAIELVSPARLRIKSAKGCQPMDTPVFQGKKGGHAFDYICTDKILRVQLSY